MTVKKQPKRSQLDRYTSLAGKISDYFQKEYPYLFYIESQGNTRLKERNLVKRKDARPPRP